MPKISEEKRSARVRNRRVHMANERTFLAWVRTSIGIMVFGFVVERFAVFVKQVEIFLGKTGYEKIPAEPTKVALGYPSVFGIVLMALGALMGVLAFVRYKKVESQIDEDTYKPSLILDVLLTVSIAAVGLFLIVYLIHTV